MISAHDVEFDATPFIQDHKAGIRNTSKMYIPAGCWETDVAQNMLAAMKDPKWFTSENLDASDYAGCRLHVFLPSCGSDDAPEDYKRWAEANRIVLLVPRTRGFGQNDVSSSRMNAHEVARGCWDTSGQLGKDFALQIAPHMQFVKALLTKLLPPDHFQDTRFTFS